MSHTEEEAFKRDVAQHEMRVLKDDGVYRHIRFKRPGCSAYWFELVTWPGYLSIVGDMGDYVFSRTKDMFGFFRNDKNEINPDYWAEKCCSASVFGEGIRRFSVAAFRENVIEYTVGFLGVESKSEIPDGVQEEIQELLEAEDEHECMSRMRDFSSELIEFTDFWEHNHTRHTTHFLWCLRAIVWGIAKYDEATKRRRTRRLRNDNHGE